VTQPLQAAAARWRSLREDPRAMRSLATGWLWLILGLVIANRAGTYATAMAGPPVGDLILDHIPTLDLTTLHVTVAIGYWLCVVAWILAHPQAHAFTTRAFALLLVVRSFFISITHLGPPPNLLKVEGPFAELILFTGDLFFSGHVGAPFLLALIFWHKPAVRWTGLAASAFFAPVVLLAQVHYSIDVFGALPIVWAIFEGSCRLFPSDRAKLLAADG
jgi:hypothetical protein